MSATPTQNKITSTQNSTPTPSASEPPANKQKCLGFKSVIDIQKILECPVCFSTPENSDQVQFCSNGHMLCDGCYQKLLIKTCPTCRSEDWNYQSPLLPVMKQILSALPKVCPFSECETQLEAKDRDEHMKNCEFRLVDCVALFNCDTKVSFNLAKMFRHLGERHKFENLPVPNNFEVIEVGNSKRVDVKLTRKKQSYYDNSSVGSTWLPTFFNVEERTFIARCYHKKNIFSFQVFLHGKVEDAQNFLYDVKVTNLDDPQFNINFTGKVISVDVPDADHGREYHPGTFSFTKAMAQDLLYENGTRICFDVTIKKKNK